jgi:RHS repeat-associated protein
LVGLLVVALLTIAPARAAEVLTYIHNDVAGNPVAATDQNGVVRWRESYRPYGERTVNAPAAAGNRQFFHGKAVDPDTGLSYFGARYYDPVVGRFMGVDPQHFDENNLHSFNRYAYANNNPYRYVDPDGRSPLDIGFLLYDLGSLAHALYQGNGVGEAAIGVGLSVVGVISPVPGTGAALKAARVAEHAVEAGRVANEVGHVAQEAGFAAKETVTVQRWMSKAELKATQETGLLRGGRDGTHYVTDAANADPLRARQRLALDRTPEVRATLEVPGSALSTSSRVNPKYNMPGGGMERTAAGNVPVRVIGVD